MEIRCAICNKSFLVRPYRLKAGVKYCSNKCYGKSKEGKPNVSCIGKPCSQKVKDAVSKANKGHIPWNKGKKFIQISGSKHPNWKGGKLTDSYEYILIHKPNHPFCNNASYVREHRLVMEKHLGRYIKPTEVVHHIDGNRQDNRLKNLLLFPNQAAHAKFHKLNSP